MHRRGLLALGIPLGLALAGATAADGAESAAAAAQPRTPLFPDDAQFWFETVRAFGASEYGGAGFGEVLATSSRIKSGDYDSWYDAWNEAGDRIAKEAAAQLAKGRRISARDSYLRASSAYRASEFFLHGNPKDPRIARAYKLSVDGYKQCAALFDPPILPVEIPYEHTTLPGYFHRVDASSRPRPTIIMHSGFDGSAEEMHVSGARAAVERGYNVLAFDGPGQFGPLHREGLVFRPDWEKVVTPAVDFTLRQNGVDPHKLVLYGASLGGELAPRAAAFEHRFAALIANDGVYDFAAPALAAVPPLMMGPFLHMLKSDSAPPIDHGLANAMKTSPTARWAITHGMWATGAATPREYLAKSLDYNLKGGVAEMIRCPTLVCDAQDDLFFKGQPKQLYDHLKCPRTLIRFTSAEGAGFHCEVGASRLAFARMFDWLDETLR
jgi:alpha-beta hydrolase superfamily lysophospholipase